MNDLVQAFDERLEEIEAYLVLLEELEKLAQDGPPKIGKDDYTITVQQQRILYSSVYLQLYNLIESTITRCIDAISEAIVERGPWQPSELSSNLRREWVRYVARTHTELTSDHRLDSALSLCEHLVQTLPVGAFKVDKGGGGNWDDNTIEDISVRLGLSLIVSAEAKSNVKRSFRNDKGTLAFIKSLRNSLAHGSISFAECGEGTTVGELRILKDRTAIYLKEIVSSFKASIDAYEFLLPERRPQRTGTGV